MCDVTPNARERGNGSEVGVETGRWTDKGKGVHGPAYHDTYVGMYTYTTIVYCTVG